MEDDVSDRPEAFEQLLKNTPGVVMEEGDACHEKPRALCTLCFVLFQIQIALIGDALQDTEPFSMLCLLQGRTCGGE